MTKGPHRLVLDRHGREPREGPERAGHVPRPKPVGAAQHPVDLGCIAGVVEARRQVQLARAAAKVRQREAPAQRNRRIALYVFKP